MVEAKGPNDILSSFKLKSPKKPLQSVEP